PQGTAASRARGRGTRDSAAAAPARCSIGSTPRPPGPGRQRTPLLRARLVEARRVERQTELAYLHFCSIAQQGGLDADAVVVRAVERAQVANLERRAQAHELGVTTRHRHVVEEDVGLG